jgi:hypothetical protein
MHWLSRSFCALGVVALVLLGACWWPEGFRAVGLDVGTLPAQASRAQRENEWGEVLDAARLDTLRRVREKERVTRELAEGNLSLFEAARRFRGLQPTPPDMWRDAVADVRGDSEGERLCRWVIGYAEGVLTDSGADPAPVVARLNAELAAHLARHGTVNLPAGKAGPRPAALTAAPPSGEGQN